MYRGFGFFLLMDCKKVYKINGCNRPTVSPTFIPRRPLKLTSTVSSQPVFVPGTIYNGTLIEMRILDESGPVEPDQIAYELGLWLAATDAFVADFERLFLENGNAEHDSRSWYRASRLAKAGLLRSAELLLRLRRSEIGTAESDMFPGSENLGDLSELLSSAIILNESLGKTGTVRSDEWKQWRNDLRTKLAKSDCVRGFENLAWNCGDDALPESFSSIMAKNNLNGHLAEVCGVVRKFSSILKALSVVGRMLRNDEPLKPSLLIFTFVYEQTQHLIGQINHRLSELTDEETEFFISLDAASYTASLEIKKAFQQELTGVVGIRPAQAIYARIEVANSLLSASFEEIIASFARILEPATQVGQIFPSFKAKLDQSLILRSGLHKTLRAVKEAEEQPEADRIEYMRNSLEHFNHEAFHFLYYKDKETLERFSEETQLMQNPKDLVPILHRFGAYLETLLSQVAMRAVLTNHPYEPAD